MTEGGAVLETRMFPILEENLGPSLDSATSLAFDLEETTFTCLILSLIVDFKESLYYL